MILYVNENNEIKDVNNTKDETLKAIIFENDYIAETWSIAKLCCYKVFLNSAGEVERLKPYVDTRLIEHIDQLGKTDEKTANNVSDTQVGLVEAYEKTVKTDSDVKDVQLALVEIYEMILGGM